MASPIRNLVDEREATNPAAREILAIIDRGNYQAAGGTTVDIRKSQAAAEAGSLLYTPEQLESMRSIPTPSVGSKPCIEMVAATTQEAAYDLAKTGPVALLNFASARNPGGGFFGRAKAQEEDLCRCSGLYRTLLRHPEYYEVHRRGRSALYTDHLIYSPSVPFFRTSSTGALLDPYFEASVITAPAPNAGAIERNEPEEVPSLPGTFFRRWTNILAVAQSHGHKTLVLGAWGCGAFRNDPQLVAKAAREALHAPQLKGAFSRIVFPIPASNKRSKANLETFAAVLTDAG